MLHKCTECTYMTTLKSNMTRHCNRKHTIINNLNNNINENECFDKNIDENVNILMNKTTFKCEKCEKILSTSTTLRNHKEICKGVKTSLECPKCHKIFSSRQSKSYHLKSCNYEKSLIPISDDKQVNNTNNIINNTTNISGNQNNTINNTVNNITILAVNPNKLDDLEFVTDHITNPQLKNILKITHQDVTDAKKVTMLEAYMRELMNNPINKCIQKTNLQNSFSKIHTGENNWTVKHDKELYPLITCNVAQGFSDLMIERNDAERMIKTERKLQELKEFLDYMADEGYRNDNIETINHQTHLLFRELVQRIKGVVFEVTKINI